MRTLFHLFTKPRFALEQIKSKPRWLTTFFLLSATSIFIYVLMHPYLVQATLSHLPLSATDEEKEIVAQTLQDELLLRCWFLQIRLLIGWSSFALVLFMICRALNPPKGIRFAKMFALEVHAEVVNILAQLATLTYLFARGDEGVNQVRCIPFSAAMFVRTDILVSFSLLNSLNVFTLFYIALLSMGVSVQSGCSRTKSFVIVLLTWLGFFLFNISALALLRDVMHLLI